MITNNNTLMVTIQCFTYNQESYIRKCLDGFITQKTNFSFEAIVHDDASTDGTPDIIREYATKYPDIIKPIYEIENQFSKQDGSLRKIMNAHTHGKYVAICEVDDYWTDPQKLQRQVDFLEKHPDNVMVCNRTKLYSEQKHQFIDDNCCYNTSQPVNVRDVILKGGLFLSTCSLLYRRQILPSTLPNYWMKCHVGDYPLQIHAAMKGGIYYINDAMSVYRVENNASWIGHRKKISIDKLIATVKSEVQMLKGFATENPRYKPFFLQRIRLFINTQYPYKTATPNDLQKYLEAFKEDILQYDTLSKIDIKMRSSHFYLLRALRPYKFKSLLQKLHIIY